MIYDFKCTVCSEEFSISQKMNETHQAKHCGTKAQRVYRHEISADRLYPYMEHNLDRNPIEVRSRNHRKKLCNERNLTDEVSWTGKRHKTKTLFFT